MRLGVFGGSFDPVHNGHVALARSCRDQAGLHEVWLTPAAVQPHKRHGPAAGDDDRLAMLRLAVEDEPGMRVSSLEVDRGGVSYTAHTLRMVAEQMPDATRYLLMGADTLNDLPSWRAPDEVLALATPLVVHRAGEPPPDFEGLGPLLDADRLELVRRSLVEMPAMEVSSSEVRGRVARGESIDELVPPRVAKWIRYRGLYRDAPPGG